MRTSYALEAAVRFLSENPLREVKDGSTIEFGTYLGNGLVNLLSLSQTYNIQLGKIFGIDSFQGLPQSNNLFPKFAAGSYSAEKDHPDPIHHIHDKCHYKDLVLIKKWFDQLDKFDVSRYNIKPAKLVIIDCDLYASAYSALAWLCENKLIQKGTLIVYDEFLLDDDFSTGECAAHRIMCNTYNVVCDEVWSWVYYDRDFGTKIEQVVYEVLSC